MGDDERKNTTESLVEEDLDLDEAKADEVRGGGLMQVMHEMKQAIVNNFRA
jgi:hypothetical protein